ncbi:hypothetical protein EGW08_002642 [Elysia chlorotica]|uniref:Uncharacterized protein n=1 Tax=Elysia chlorotica TaxID=188477 RepID=A0A3S1BRF3_ELYCH|nr:hypothetical protein EGW08_002642 [Elysia chlorotica]
MYMSKLKRKLRSSAASLGQRLHGSAGYRSVPTGEAARGPDRDTSSQGGQSERAAPVSRLRKFISVELLPSHRRPGTLGASKSSTRSVPSLARASCPPTGCAGTLGASKSSTRSVPSLARAAGAQDKLALLYAHDGTTGTSSSTSPLPSGSDTISSKPVSSYSSCDSSAGSLALLSDNTESDSVPGAQSTAGQEGDKQQQQESDDKWTCDLELPDTFESPQTGASATGATTQHTAQVPLTRKSSRRLSLTAGFELPRFRKRKHDKENGVEEDSLSVQSMDVSGAALSAKKEVKTRETKSGTGNEDGLVGANESTWLGNARTETERCGLEGHGRQLARRSMMLVSRVGPDSCDIHPAFRREPNCRSWYLASPGVICVTITGHPHDSRRLATDVTWVSVDQRHTRRVQADWGNPNRRTLCWVVASN